MTSNAQELTPSNSNSEQQPGTVGMGSLWRKSLIPLCSALIFASIFALHYAKIPDIDYKDRDDGIITLSHARNFVEYGSISINPSGERIEAFSSPLQFVIYAICFALTGLSYSIYSFFLTWSSILIIGFFFVLFLKQLPLLKRLLLVAVSALLLAQDYSFLGWHGSGMENALLHLAFIVSLYALFHMYGKGKMLYWSSGILFCAAISRIEAIFHLAPLLLIFCLLWTLRYKNWKAIWLLLLTCGLWVAFNALRYWYFGALFPHTAAAQAISPWDRIMNLMDSFSFFFNRDFELSKQIFTAHYGFLFVLFLPLVAVLWRRKEDRLLILLLASILLTSMLAPFIFGPARIDITRTTTQLALCSVLAFAVLVSAALREKHSLKALAPYLIPMIFLFFLFRVEPYYLGWKTQAFLENHNRLQQVQDEHQLFRSTVAYPDIGVGSWQKDFNIIDLGSLGNHVLSSLNKSKGQDSTADYLFEIEAPDMLTLHHSWTVRYSFLFFDERFEQTYSPVITTWNDYLEEYGDGTPDNARK
jgi:hypothetical protein